MKKIIRLTESDLTRIIKRVISEQIPDSRFETEYNKKFMRDNPIKLPINLDNDDKIDPPIQTENFLSAGATTLIYIVFGASNFISLLSLS